MLRGDLPAAIDGEARSEKWSDSPKPVASAHVASYRRGHFLPDLFAALESQALDADNFEVVVVDDASGDGTWEILRDLVERTPLRALALRLATNSGPATARNTAVAASHADVLAFTDDDCIPDSRWLSELTAAVGREGTVVQGRVLPPPGELDQAGPWDHAIQVNGPTPFFETCNIAYLRSEFDAVGGFDTTDPLLHPGEGQHFGEDVVLGARVVERGATRGFAPDAVIYHRFIRQGFLDHLRAHRKVKGFPGLARRSPIFVASLRKGLFLTRRSAAFDLAALSIGVAALTRKPVALVGVAPWTALAFKAVRLRTQDPLQTPVVLAGMAAKDLVNLLSLVEGSVRYRRPIL